MSTIKEKITEQRIKLFKELLDSAKIGSLVTEEGEGLKLTREEIIDLVNDPKEFLKLSMEMERHSIEVHKELDRFADRETYKNIKEKER